MLICIESGKKESPMEDLWRVKSSAVDKKDLVDLAEYHRFLNRFQIEETETRKRDLLYRDIRLGSPGKKGSGE